jgi:heptosyltransferase-3
MIKRILIIRPDKIGDLILTLPMATVIKRYLPEANVAFLVREYTASLLGLAPDVDKTVIYDTNWSLSKTISVLRSAKPDAIFFFGSKFKLTLAAFFARIPIRVGRAYWWYSFLYNKKIYEHRKTAGHNEAEYNVRMLAAIDMPTDRTPFPHFDHTLLPKLSFPRSNYFVLHITTGGSTQAWNEESFISLAANLKQKLDHPIILTGIPAEYEYLLRIGERMKQSSCDVHIMTENTLPELASILTNARLVVACGTGPGHLAASLGTPTIGLFPNVLTLSKERWGFRGEHVVNISPTTMPRAECPYCKDCICINEITVPQVIEAVNDLII